MIKRIIFIPLLTMLLFAGIAYAQTNELLKPGILPDSPFYFMKKCTEGIGTFFTFGDLKKAERYLKLSEKRLAEANALVTKGKPEVAPKTVEKYQEHLNKALSQAEEAKAKGLDTDEVLTKVAEATFKHQLVLADVYKKVPEQAKPAIERAMQVSLRGHEEALKAISGQKQEEVMEQVEQKGQEAEQKLDELRKEGVPIPKIPSAKEILKTIPVQPKGGKTDFPEQIETGEEAETPEIPRIQEKPQTPSQP